MQCYTISYKSHLRAARTILFYASIAILAIFIIVLQNISINSNLIKGIAGIIILFNGPAVFLHYSYYLENNNWTLKEFDDEIEISKNNSNSIQINKDNIKSIIFFMSAGVFDHGVTTGLPTEDYNYVIFTTDKEEIIITNLIYPDIKKLSAKFMSITPQINRTLFANI